MDVSDLDAIPGFGLVEPLDVPDKADGTKSFGNHTPPDAALDTAFHAAGNLRLFEVRLFFGCGSTELELGCGDAICHFRAPDPA